MDQPLSTSSVNSSNTGDNAISSNNANDNSDIIIKFKIVNVEGKFDTKKKTFDIVNGKTGLIIDVSNVEYKYDISSDEKNNNESLKSEEISKPPLLNDGAAATGAATEEKAKVVEAANANGTATENNSLADPVSTDSGVNVKKPEEKGFVKGRVSQLNANAKPFVPPKSTGGRKSRHQTNKRKMYKRKTNKRKR